LYPCPHYTYQHGDNCTGLLGSKCVPCGSVDRRRGRVVCTVPVFVVPVLAVDNPLCSVLFVEGVWFSARQVFCNRRKTAVRREVWLVRNDDVSCSLGNSHLIMCLCPQGTERGILAVVRLFAINFTWCEKNVENMWLVCYGGRRSMELMDQLDERFDEALASPSRFEVGHVA